MAMLKINNKSAHCSVNIKAISAIEVTKSILNSYTIALRYGTRSIVIKKELTLTGVNKVEYFLERLINAGEFIVFSDITEQRIYYEIEYKGCSYPYELIFKRLEDFDYIIQ